MHSEDGERGQLVVVREVRFRSMCEHHLLPFIGVAHLAYAPGGSSSSASAPCPASSTPWPRAQLQERLGEQVAAAVTEGLDAAGVLVVLDAPATSASPRGANGSRGRRR